jgi:hypothetical protein
MEVASELEGFLSSTNLSLWLSDTASFSQEVISKSDTHSNERKVKLLIAVYFKLIENARDVAEGYSKRAFTEGR